MGSSMNSKKYPKTQKGKSILKGCPDLQEWCDDTHLRGYQLYNYNKTHPILIRTKADIEQLSSNIWKNKIFARPCPKTPRHGFVDSRVISSKKELHKLLNQVLKIDSEGEIILTHFIDKATCNAVFSINGLLSIGPKHDGATAGIKSFSLPVKPEKFWKKFPDLVSNSGLQKKDNIFVEGVFTKPSKAESSYDPVKNNGLHITQVRGGPPVKAITDYIPQAMIVKHIIKPNNDLVAWETEVKKLKPGTVVYAKGHTLASHAAIHCVLNKVPFITSFLPKINQTLSPIQEKKINLNYRQFRLGVSLALSSTHDITRVFHVSAAILHNWAYIKNSEHASWLLGMAAGYLCKVMCAINLGEYRHFCNSTNNSSYTRRNSLYTKVITSNKLNLHMKKMPNALKTFSSERKYKPAFGGPRWAKSSKYNILIWNAIAKINYYGLTEARANKLVSLINKSINLVHNNGWLFNKVSSEFCLDYLAEYSGLSAFQLSDSLYNFYINLRKVKRLKSLTPIKI